MLEKLTIIDRIEIYASAGMTSAPLKLWGKQIESLSTKGGFTIEVLKPTKRYGEFNCTIRWDNPKGVQASYMLAQAIKALGKRIDSKIREANNLSQRLSLVNGEIDSLGKMVSNLNANLADSLKLIR